MSLLKAIKRHRRIMEARTAKGDALPSLTVRTEKVNAKRIRHDSGRDSGDLMRKEMGFSERRRFRREIKGILRSIRLMKRRKAGELDRERILNPKAVPKSGVNVSELALISSICRESFYDFVKEFWTTIIQAKPVWNWHIQFLCDQLQFMAERVFEGLPKLYDLVVNIPPGTTKSTIISVMFPIWCWTRMPSMQFIGASFSETLALELSLKSRDIVESDKFKECFPEVQLRSDQNTKTMFKNTKGGWRYAVGVNGTVTGLHAHIIGIDDPIDPLKARSVADIKTANYWIDKQLSNRKVDKKVSVMILVMQRLHQDDPTTLFLKRNKVYHVCLPAELDETVRPSELKDYYVNGLLDANRLDKDVLKEEKQKGEQYYASQFMQNPVPAEGAMFKVSRLKTGQTPDKWKTLVRFWDKAGTSDGGTFTVGTLMGLDYENRFWVLDIVRGQWDSSEREKVIRRTADLDGFKVRIGVEQEPGSGGKESAEATATKTLRGYRCKVIKVDKTTGGKEQRADPWSVQVNHGNVYLPSHCKNEVGQWQDWAEEWVEEHKYFPFGRYKDQVDSASLAFSMANTRRIKIGGMAVLDDY